MNSFTSFLQNKMVPLSNRFANLPFMIVLRSSVLTIVPMMIVGAIGTFMTNIPLASLAEFVEPASPFFNAMVTVTSNICGLVVAGAVGYFTAERYELDSLFGIITSLTAFFAATLTDEWAISVDSFGASGIFTAIIVGYISVYISHLCRKYHIEIKMPDSVPPMVANSFSTIISLGISVCLLLVVRVLLKVDINEGITHLLSPIANSLNTLPVFLFYSFLTTLLFICGIHPGVVFGFLMPILVINSELNAAAVAAGELPSQFVTWGMASVMNFGGTGATIGLTILSCFSKAESQKTLGKLSIFPSIFNINEPMVYGFPIMFNPVLMVPFILVPLVNILSTWFLMSTNIIGGAYIPIPWTTPPIFNGFLMSGGNIGTAIWTGLLVLISVAIYYPFFKVAEKIELDKLGEAQKIEETGIENEDRKLSSNS